MPKQSPQTFISFDFGMSRIGVAIGNTSTQTARPLKTLPARDGIPNWNTIKNILDQWSIDAIIVGMPYTLDNKHQDITFAARKFSNRLKQKYKLPIFIVDERFSTKIARQEMKKKQEIDSISACIILEAWLNEKRIPPSHNKHEDTQ
tara:strand:- start:49 stop:489 length:441 start_codon:yes stop_codon:yes gene_type:complete